MTDKFFEPRSSSCMFDWLSNKYHQNMTSPVYIHLQEQNSVYFLLFVVAKNKLNKYSFLKRETRSYLQKKTEVKKRKLHRRAVTLKFTNLIFFLPLDPPASTV